MSRCAWLNFGNIAALNGCGFDERLNVRDGFGAEQRELVITAHVSNDGAVEEAPGPIGRERLVRISDGVGQYFCPLCPNLGGKMCLAETQEQRRMTRSNISIGGGFFFRQSAHPAGEGIVWIVSIICDDEVLVSGNGEEDISTQVGGFVDFGDRINEAVPGDGKLRVAGFGGQNPAVSFYRARAAPHATADEFNFAVLAAARVGQALVEQRGDGGDKIAGERGGGRRPRGVLLRGFGEGGAGKFRRRRRLGVVVG
jgi:hypothetical protein